MGRKKAETRGNIEVHYDWHKHGYKVQVVDIYANTILEEYSAGNSQYDSSPEAAVPYGQGIPMTSLRLMALKTAREFKREHQADLIKRDMDLCSEEDKFYDSERRRVPTIGNDV